MTSALRRLVALSRASVRKQPDAWAGARWAVCWPNGERLWDATPHPDPKFGGAPSGPICGPTRAGVDARLHDLRVEAVDAVEAEMTNPEQVS